MIGLRSTLSYGDFTRPQLGRGAGLLQKLLR